MKISWKQFGLDLRKAREACDFSLRQAAALYDMHYSTWYRSENGRPLDSVGMYLILCRWMSVDPFKYLQP
ncbi:helix-turn-helix domain-containing protein [Bradyrhizobium genosp. P]|uniref:helix-turn-helix domain-containing protein n=1 Tax=Bradyrhizobium genosp. P TaxID=83641 RepID=UPI003CF6B987